MAGVSLVSTSGDPLSEALAVVQTINQVIVALINKASTPEIDALIHSHILHRDAVFSFAERLAEKLLHLPKSEPATVK
jgi:hypothetical protein